MGKKISKTTCINVLIYSILMSIIIIALIPIIEMILTALRPGTDVLTISPKWIPSHFTLENFNFLFSTYRISSYLINSIIVSLSTTILSVAIGSLAAYGFARFRFPADNIIFFAILVVRMIPGITIAIPIYIFFFKLGLLDSLEGLILIHTTINIPFVVWMMRRFIMEIPGEIDESAKIDGCSNMGIFLKMILPLASSGLAAAAIFTFMLSWNEFLLAFILTSSPKAQTMPVFLSNFILEHEVLWDRLCAGGFIMLVPILAFSSIIQKYIIKGLSYGAIKG